MIHLKFISNHLQDRILQWSSACLIILHVDEVIFRACYAKNNITVQSIIKKSLFALITFSTINSFSYAFTKIVNLLLCNGLCIHYLKAIQIDNLFNIIVLINFIKDLPSNIVVYLLEHFLELILSNSVFFIRTIFTADVLFIGFLLKLSPYLFIFINNIIAFLS